MLLRVVVLSLAGAYVAFRVWLAAQVARARRRGDTRREAALRARTRAATRWALVVVVLAGLFLVLLVALNSRG